MDLEAARQLLPGLDIKSVSPLEGGEVHANYALTTADGRELVLKVYRRELGWKLDKERYLLELVGRLRAAPVPEVVSAQPSALVLTRLPGRPARFADADPVAVRRQVGEVLRGLHAITFENFGYIETGVTAPAASNVEYMRRRIERKVRNGPARLREALDRYFAENEDVFTGCAQAVLCHNDAHDANVLVADGVVTGLLDWENAVAADPILDLAKAHAFSDGRSEATLAALVEGYGPLRADWREAFELYVADHLLELWIWLREEGVTEPLERIEDALARLAGAD
jgi:Ser/Thr protein kinase RdoA (MazF antagonist)